MLCFLLLFVLPLPEMEASLCPSIHRVRCYILVNSPARKEQFPAHAPRKRVVILMSIEVVDAYFQFAACFFNVEQLIGA